MSEQKGINRLTDMGKRFDAVIDNLKDSIRARGVQNALWVRLDGSKDNKQPVLVDGECRLRAVMELIAEGVDIPVVPVVQKSLNVAKPEERLVLALTANDGLPISQMEVGKTYIKLRNYGKDNAWIATETGKSERYVREAIAIADAPDEVRALVASGDVSQSVAIKAVKEQGADAAAAFLAAAAEQNKADGKTGPVRAPKADKKESKIKLIRGVIEDYEALDPKEFTKDELVKFLGDISDILDDNPAFVGGSKPAAKKTTAKSKKAA